MKGDRYYVHQALSTAVVVSCARPFTRNRPDGPLGKRWTQFSDSRLQELHDQLLTLRHQQRAHSDTSVRRVRIVPPGVRLTHAIAPADAVAWTLERTTRRVVRGYPTEKPVALLQTLIGQSSRPGEVVLDPFCGSGNTGRAARDLGGGRSSATSTPASPLSDCVSPLSHPRRQRRDERTGVVARDFVSVR